MTKTQLTYNHTRNIFKGNEWKPGITKWFKNPRFAGTETGNWFPKLIIENWEEVKDKLPKTLRPIEAITI